MSTITTEYKGDMLFETTVGKHRLTIDVPANIGGKDRGPMPPQLFIASLGSCVGALVAEYCERHGEDTRDMSIDVDYEKTDHPSRLANIKVTVRLPNADCSKQCRRDALRRVAEHCPVHKTIETLHGVEFKIVGG